MSIGRIKYRLNKTNFQGAANVDSYFNINLESEIKLLPPGEINRLVNVGEVFDSERQSSTRYRIINTLLPVFSNVLFNISGDKGPNTFNNPNGITADKSYGYQTFDGYMFKSDPYDNDFVGIADFTYTESIEKHLKEIDGWFGFYNPDIRKAGFCEFFDLEPTRLRFDLNSSLVDRNWEFTITYPYLSEDQHYLVNGGLLVNYADVIDMGGVQMIVFGTPVPHNLSVGDTVRLTDMPSTDMNGDHSVISLGLSDGTDRDLFFVVNVDPANAILGTLFNNGRMKRLYYGNEVTYYLRKFKKIKSFQTQSELTTDSFETYPLAFSKNIYDDQNYQVAFKDDIDVSDLVDNLGRPLSELYLTMVKTKSNNIFTKVISGFDLPNYIGNVGTTTPEDRDVSNIRKMHTIAPPIAPFQSHTQLESDAQISNMDFYGDICEYSKYEARETKLLSVMHRFNTVDREVTTIKSITGGSIGGPRNEGYIYYPHHLIKIRQFSNYVEQGDSSTDGIPDYAENLGDGRYLWRDLLPIGINDGQDETLDYPFLNACHYMYQNLCIYTRRQDPFGYFGLLYTEGTPKDTSGDGINNNFVTKKSDDVC
jgi:hypothetical protein